MYFDGHEKDKFETYFGALSLDFKAAKSTKLSLIAAGFLSNELVTYDISGEYWLDQAGTSGEDGIGGELGVGKYHEHARNRLKSSVFSVTLKGNTALGSGKHTLGYGLVLKSERIMDRSREWELRDSAGFSLPVASDGLKMVYNQSSHNDLNSTRFNTYVMDNMRFNTKYGYITANAGVRLSYWSFNKEFLFSPRVHVGFVPEKNNRWAFRFATGLYYQAPFFKEFRMPVEDMNGNQVIRFNENIKSQRSYQVILGSDYTFRAFNRPFKLTGELYYKALGNLVPYEIDNLKVNYSGVNASSGMTAGIDFKLFGQFVPGSDSWISFSLMKTQETLNGVKVPRPTDQRYSFALYF
ncbi:MAG: TonB-dependent receptor, partial [Paramuribaculum sp.]|nr:TonB-dependent receptor [Paramuribaculum sp.]